MGYSARGNGLGGKFGLRSWEQRHSGNLEFRGPPPQGGHLASLPNDFGHSINTFLVLSRPLCSSGWLIKSCLWFVGKAIDGKPSLGGRRGGLGSSIGSSCPVVCS